MEYFVIYSDGAADRSKRNNYIQPGEAREFKLEYDRREPKKPTKHKNTKPEESLSVWSTEYTKKEESKARPLNMPEKIHFDELEEECYQVRTTENYQYSFAWTERCQAILDDATPEWIEAQRKHEIAYNVPEEHRITSKVRAKPFSPAEKIFILVNDHAYWMRIACDALRMGLDSVDVIEAGVLVVSEASSIPKEQRSTLAGVNYVRPQYIKDCLQRFEKLSITPYLIPMI